MYININSNIQIPTILCTPNEINYKSTKNIYVHTYQKVCVHSMPVGNSSHYRSKGIAVLYYVGRSLNRAENDE